MVTEVKLEQPEKRLSLIAVTLEPIVTSANNLPKLGVVPEMFRPRYNFSTELGRLELLPKFSSASPSSMVNVFMLEQPLNAYRPMLVTELEMVTEVRLEQPEKSLSLMVVTLEPIVASTNDLPKLDTLPERSRPRYNFSTESGRL